MLVIPGFYRLVKLHETAQVLICRAIRQSDQRAVIVKILKGDAPAPEKVMQLKRELHLRARVRWKNRLELLTIEAQKQRVMGVFADPGGETLQQVMRRKRLSVTASLRLAVQMTRLLDAIHSADLHHLGLTPSILLIGTDYDVIDLIDFSSASLDHQVPARLIFLHELIFSANCYLAPEQNGQTHQSPDYRSDLYAFGVILYELICGRKPFASKAIHEPRHASVAADPAFPSEVDPDIPEQVSRMLLKMMAKNPEQRYQSAGGIRADSELCLRKMQSEGRVGLFPLGRQDSPDKFCIKDKRYGRDAELDRLMEAYDRICEGGKAVVVLSGPAGMGRSSLAMEMVRPVIQQKGVFVTARFDPFSRRTPFGALVETLRAFCRQVLAGGGDVLEGWRARLQAAVGENGRVMTDAIPEMTAIIGDQPPVSTLDVSDDQNRFAQVLGKVFRVCCRADHPLVVFLDDFQWVDIASLRFVETLARMNSLTHLMILVSIVEKENLGSAAIPLIMERIRKEMDDFQVVELGPLSLASIIELLTDLFHVGSDPVVPLAETVLEKTGGTPFFINAFLRALHGEGLIAYDGDAGGWQWDLIQIQARPITAHAVDPLYGRLSRLTPETRNLLQHAACLGRRFDLSLLAIILESAIQETADLIREALTAKLILPLDDAGKLFEVAGSNARLCMGAEYAFFHERIQLGAYELIPEPDRDAFHWKIGRLLWDGLSSEAREIHRYDIVNHLNRGAGCVSDPMARHCLGRINLDTARAARHAGACESDYAYCRKGLSVLPESVRLSTDPLALDLWVEALEAAFSSGEYAEMDTIFSHVMTLKDLPFEIQMRLYETRIKGCVVQNRNREAMDAAVQACARLQMPIHKQPGRLGLVLRILAVKAQLMVVSKGRKAGLDRLCRLPEMTDPRARAALRIFSLLGPGAYLTAPEQMVQIVLRAVSLSLKYGNSPVSPYFYAAYGLIQSGIMGNIRQGRAFLDLADALIEAGCADGTGVRTRLMLLELLAHWTVPLRDTLEPLEKNRAMALRIGDAEYAAFSAKAWACQALLAGVPLPKIAFQMDESAALMRRHNQLGTLVLHQIYQQTIATLRTPSDSPCAIVSEACNPLQMIPGYRISGDRIALGVHYFCRLYLSVVFGETDEAVRCADQLTRYLDRVIGASLVPVSCQLDSLSRLRQMDPKKRTWADRKRLARVRQNQRKLGRWARQCPVNYKHRYVLVQAERCRVTGRVEAAMNLYDQSIQLARENRYLSDEGLASEFAGHFYEGLGKPHIARYYYQDAIYAYINWGAFAKVAQLNAHLHDSARAGAPPFSPFVGLSATVEEAGEGIDLQSFIKAARAISGEIVRERILERLMQRLIENAGARKGFLILNRDGELIVEARQTTDAGDPMVMDPVPLENATDLPITMVRYVERTGDSLVIFDAANWNRFSRDAYVIQHPPRPVICMPIMLQKKVEAIIYLENAPRTGVFTEDRVKTLQLLASQAEIAIEHAQMYQRLEESERKYRGLFENAVEGIFQIDMDGRIISANPALAQVMGYDSPEALIDSVRYLGEASFVDPADHRAFEQEMVKEGRVSGFETRLYRKDGRVFWGSLSSRVMTAADNTPLYYEGAIVDITSRKHAQAHIRSLTQELIKAQENERQRISFDLHDNVAQDLASLTLACETFFDGEPETSGRLRARMQQISSVLKGSIKTIRDLAYGLQPPSLDQLGLVQALFQYCEEFSETTGLQVDFNSAGIEELDLGFDTEINLYRLAQEALNNVRKHAGATRVVIRFVASSPNIILRIEDNGSGFDVAASSVAGGHEKRMGLRSMRERVNMLGGDMRLVSRLGEGTRIHVKVPMP
ncbi:MAG: hypothetical protein CSA22_02865 [Deltaproteobacteria bacterium]|nr:MAG: hypothetical protein CSA22_02865 [Deltaproteobacteria bacterium]